MSSKLFLLRRGRSPREGEIAHVGKYFLVSAQTFSKNFPVNGSNTRPTFSRGSSLLPVNHLPAVHIGLQNFGDGNGSILLLEIFQNRDKEPSRRQTGPVQGMDKCWFAALFFETDFCPPRLIVGKVTTG